MRLLIALVCATLTWAAEPPTKEVREDLEGMLGPATERARQGDEEHAVSLIANHLAEATIIDLPRLLPLVADPRRFDQVCALIAVSPQASAILDGLPQDARGRSVTAGILAAQATMGLLEQQRRLQDPAPVKSRKREGKVRRKDREAAEAATIRLPDGPLAAVLASTQAGTLHRGLVAAACAGHPAGEVLLRRDDLRTRHPGLACLWAARAGRPVDEALAAKALGMAPGTVVRTAGAALSTYDPLLPEACYALQALALGGDMPEALRREVGQALGSPDVRIQVDAARALRAANGPESVTLALKHLAQAPWPVLIDYCGILGEHPEARSVEPLIAQLERTQGRLRLDLQRALASIAGGQSGRASVAQWTAWWKGTAGGFVPDPAKSADYRATNGLEHLQVDANGYFYDLPIFSDRFAYVLDASCTMKGDRMASLRVNLAASLHELKPGCQFNILRFSGDLQAFSSTKGRPALTTDRAGGATFLNGVRNSVGTRVYDAIEAALRCDELDTVVLLSDATTYFTMGGTWEAIKPLLAFQTRHRPVALSTVLFDASGRKADLVKALTRDHDGRFLMLEE